MLNYLELEEKIFDTKVNIDKTLTISGLEENLLGKIVDFI